MRVLKDVLTLHGSSDAHLQYRGINVLERLEKGCTKQMPKQTMLRSQSMRAEELVRFYQRTAESFVAAGSPSGGSRRFMASQAGGGESKEGGKMDNVEEAGAAEEEEEVGI